MNWHRGWAPYVPVAQRRRRSESEAKKLLKKGQTLAPVQISGRAIATTFWGKSWCDHVEGHCDYSNRLPRGRTYARNGSVVDLQIAKGKVTALVSGSSLYRINISISPLESSRWKHLCSRCASSIHSLIDLMRGKLSPEVIRRLTDPKAGMFPKSGELKLSCSCPDGAYLCKHLAAVLYGIGHRLDHSPELLFVLRGVNQSDLVALSIDNARLGESIGLDQASTIADADLSEMFGIDLAGTTTTAKPTRQIRRMATGKAVKKSAVKKSAVKKTAVKKTAVKKTAVKKTAVKKSAVKKTAVKKTAVKKTAVKKTAVKKSAVKKLAVKKLAVKTKAGKPQ
jgi:uncharacterized Zn finger protein